MQFSTSNLLFKGFLTASFLGLFVIIGYSKFGSRADINLTQSNEERAYNYKITFRELVLLFKIKTVIGILLFVVCSGIAASTLANWSVFYLDLKLNNKGMAILLYLIAGLGALPGAVMGGSLGDAYFKLGRIKGSSTGNQFAIFSDVTDSKLRGTVNSMSGIMTNIGGIIGNLLVSTLIQTNIQMISTSIVIVLVIWLFGSFLWIIPYFYYSKELNLRRKIIIIKQN